ncbi:hypothetical protein RDOM_000528, partial [Rhyzopertha dominica]
AQQSPARRGAAGEALQGAVHRAEEPAEADQEREISDTSTPTPRCHKRADCLPTLILFCFIGTSIRHSEVMKDVNAYFSDSCGNCSDATAHPIRRKAGPDIPREKGKDDHIDVERFLRSEVKNLKGRKGERIAHFFAPFHVWKKHTHTVLSATPTGGALVIENVPCNLHRIIGSVIKRKITGRIECPASTTLPRIGRRLVAYSTRRKLSTAEFATSSKGNRFYSVFVTNSELGSNPLLLIELRN